MKAVEMGKKYVTVSLGLPVEIVRINVRTRIANRVIVLITEVDGTETPMLLNEFGCREVDDTPFIVEAGSYHHINKGDRVIVWDQDYQVKGYFAGVDSAGQPMIWASGKTEWSANGDRTSFKFCKKVPDDPQS